MVIRDDAVPGAHRVARRTPAAVAQMGHVIDSIPAALRSVDAAVILAGGGIARHGSVARRVGGVEVNPKVNPGHGPARGGSDMLTSGRPPAV